MATSGFDPQQSLDSVDDEQLPVPPHKQHGAKHFLGLYAAEHVAATEFVIGATFVGLGAGIWDILIGLVIGNTLAILSFTLITAPIAVGTRLSLFAYLERIAGNVMAKLYNGANVVIFAAISAAMITVSATAVRVLFDVPPQVAPYPTDMAFVIIAFAVFLLIRAINQLKRKEEAAPAPAPTTKDCPYCLSAVPLKATRCGHCTSDLTAA